jgi:hypothetical protein
MLLESILQITTWFFLVLNFLDVYPCVLISVVLCHYSHQEAVRRIGFLIGGGDVYL